MLLDRIQIHSGLIVAAFISVLLLESQSAASYSSYFLALSMLVSFRQWDDVFRHSFVWLVGTLLLYLASSSFWSAPFQLRDVLSYGVRAVLVFFFVVAFAECQLRGQLQRWLGRALAIAGFICTAAAIVVFLVEQPDDNRLNGLGQLDTHVIAALVFSVTLIFVLDALLRERSSRWKILLVLAFFCIVVAVYLSDSRNAWVSMVVGFGVFALANWVRKPEEFIMSVFVLTLLLGVVIVVLYLNEGTREFILPRGDSFRLAIWAHHFEKVMNENWLFGIGIATTDNFRLNGIEFLHPHNMYLAVFSQGGLVGFGLFLAVVGFSFRTLIASYEQADAKVALSIFAVALSSYLLDGHELLDKVGATWFLFWLPVAISLGLNWGRALRGSRP